MKAILDFGFWILDFGFWFALRTSHKILLSIVLVIATCAVYWQVRRFELVNIDDDKYIIKNAVVQKGLTWSNVGWAFTALEVANWHPLTWMSHMLDVSMFGWRNGSETLNTAWATATGKHHLVSLGWHCVDAVLLFIVLMALTGAPWRSWLVATLFALHPLHVESVAWVSERKDVLSTFFGLIAILCYVHWVKIKPTWWRYALMMVAFALSLLAKPMLVTLPCLLLLLDYWPLKRLQPVVMPAQITSRHKKKKKNTSRGEPVMPTRPPVTVTGLVIEKLPLFALSLASSVTTVIAQHHGGAVESITRTPITMRIANALVSYASYIAQTVWPIRMAAMYPYPSKIDARATAVSALLIITITAIVLWWRKVQPFLLVGWLWFLGMLVPVIGLLQVGSQSRADRYTYLPLVGLFIMAVWLIPHFARGVLKPSPVLKMAIVTPIAAILVVLGIVSFYQISYWRNSVALYDHAFAVTKDNSFAHNNYAVALKEEGKVDEAIAHFREALRIRPRYAQAAKNLGGELLTLNRIDEGVKYLQVALDVDPRYAEAHSDMGYAYSRRNELEAAQAEFEKAISLNPNLYTAYANLGALLINQQKFAKAIGPLNMAVQLRGSDYVSRQYLGVALMDQHRYPEAIEQFQQVLLLKPDYLEARNRLAWAYFESGQIDKAVAEGEQIIRLVPNDPKAYDNLARVLTRGGRDGQGRDAKRALELASKACAMTDHRDPAMLSTLAQAYAVNGQFDQAVMTAQTGLGLAKSVGMTVLVEDLQNRLALYQQHRSE